LTSKQSSTKNAPSKNPETLALNQSPIQITPSKLCKLVMTFVGFGWENGEPISERWSAILDGYQSIRTLSEEEISALPNLHKIATLSIAAWRYWQFKINMPGTEHENRYLEMTSRLDKVLPF